MQLKMIICNNFTFDWPQKWIYFTMSVASCSTTASGSKILFFCDC